MSQPLDSLTESEATFLANETGQSVSDINAVIAEQTDLEKRKRLVALIRAILAALGF